MGVGVSRCRVKGGTNTPLDPGGDAMRLERWRCCVHRAGQRRCELVLVRYSVVRCLALRCAATRTTCSSVR